MNWLLLVLMALALFVALTASGPLALIIPVFIVATTASLWLLQKYFRPAQRGQGVAALFVPSIGTSFAEHAPTTAQGEVLLPYQTYKVLRRRLSRTVITGICLLVVTLIGLRTVPVPALLILLPAAVLFLAIATWTIFNLVHTVPKGERWSVLRTLLVADPRAVFAQFAPTTEQGELKVGYTTYKRFVRASSILVVLLALLAGYSLIAEIRRSQQNADQNVAAAVEQLQALTESVLTGQGDIKNQVGKLVAQSLEPAPTLDEASLTSRVLAAVTKELPLPDAPTTIVREELTKNIETTIVQQDTRNTIALKDGASFVFQDDSGRTYAIYDSDAGINFKDGSTLNIQGIWQLDGAQVTATATDLNVTSKLDNTSSGDEGSRYVGTRSVNFTNFSPSRDDVEAALAAIDSALGTTGAAAAPVGVAYVTIGSDSTLSGERGLAAGTGLSLTDGGANGSATLAISTVPVASGGTNNTSAYTAGSVIFSDGSKLTQDNSNFYWNDSSNRLGIGTTAPAVTLDVNGNAYVQGTLSPNAITGYAGTLSISATNYLQLHGSNAVTDIAGTSGNDLRIVGDANATVGKGVYIKAHNGSGWVTTLQSLNKSGTPDLILQPAGGNVGIGTTAPAASLETTGSILIANNQFLNGKDSGGSSRVLIGMDLANQVTVGNTSSSGGTYINSGNTIRLLVGAAYRAVVSSDGLAINNGSAGPGSGNGLIVASGNVGIGTTAPLSAQHVNVGTSDVSGLFVNRNTNAQSILINPSATIGAFIVGATRPDGTSNQADAAGRIIFQGGGFSGLQFQTSPATTVGNARTFTTGFELLTTGNVYMANALAVGSNTFPIGAQLYIRKGAGAGGDVVDGNGIVQISSATSANVWLNSASGATNSTIGFAIAGTIKSALTYNVTSDYIGLTNSGSSPTFTDLTVKGGLVGVGTNTQSDAQLTVVASSANTKGLIVKGATSQSANLQEWQNSSGTILGSVASTGALSIQGPSTTDSRFILGSLGIRYFNSGGQSIQLIDTNGSVWLSFSYPTGEIAFTSSGNGKISWDTNQYLELRNSSDLSQRFVTYSGSAISWLFRDSANVDFVKIRNQLAGSGNERMQVNAITATTKGITIVGAASQSANLQEWQNSSGTPLATVEESGQIQGTTDGIATLVSAGACSDSTTTVDTNGLICIDSSNGRIYYRYGGAWHYSAQTAGFQIPNLVTDGKNETEGLEVGDLVIGRLNERLEDGALHGLYEKFDLQAEISKILATNQGLTANDLKDLTIKGTLTVHGKTTFLSDVAVKGALTRSNEAAGFAVIPKGHREVLITYKYPFSEKPVVTFSVEGTHRIDAGLNASSKTGFGIRLAEPAPANLTFSWVALSIANTQTVTGQGEEESTTEATPTPSASPEPESSEEITPVEPIPVVATTPVPSPTVKPTPIALPDTDTSTAVPASEE